jgi:hypothetical protein
MKSDNSDYWDLMYSSFDTSMSVKECAKNFVDCYKESRNI